MSSRINDYSKCKGNISTEVRSNAKWRDVCRTLTLTWNNWEVGGGGEVNVEVVGQLRNGIRSWDLHSFPLVLLSYHAKSDKWKLWERMHGKSKSKNSSQSDWRGVPSHNPTRLHIDFKSEGSVLNRKVSEVFVIEP